MPFQHKFQVQGAATLVDEALLTVVTLLEEMRQKGPEPNVSPAMQQSAHARRASSQTRAWSS